MDEIKKSRAEQSDEDLTQLIARAQSDGDLVQKSELRQVSQDIGENRPSNSNFEMDEFRLFWRGTNILKRLSPKSVKILENYADSRRSVDGWTTNKKVEAIVGIQQQRSGSGILQKIGGLFQPKQPQ